MCKATGTQKKKKIYSIIHIDIDQIIKYSRLEDDLGGHLVQAPALGRNNFKEKRVCSVP